RAARCGCTAAARRGPRAPRRALAGRAARRARRGTAARARATVSDADRVARVARAEPIVRRRFACALALLLASAPAIHAHGLDPASLTLRETARGIFDVQWRESALRLPGTDVRPVLPARCRETSVPRAEDGVDHVTLRWTIDCGADGL